MADFDPSFNPDYNPDKPAKETKQASGFNANFNPDYNPDAGVVDEAPPAEPTDTWLKSLTGTSAGSAGVFSGSKNAAQLQADYINKKRGTNEALNVVARLNKGTAGTLRNVAAAAAEAGDLVGYTATQLLQPALGPQSFQTSIENIKQYRGEGGIGEGIRKATKRMDEFIEEGTKARVPMFTKNEKGGHDFNWKEYGNYWDMLVENAPQLAVQYGAGAKAFQNAVNAGRSVDEAAAIAGRMSGRIEGAQLFGDAMDAANKKGVPLVKAVPVSAAVALVGTAISSGVPGGKKISSVLKKGEPGAIKTAVADMADKGLEGIFFKKAHEIAESTTGIKGRLARFALSGAKEATEEGLQEVASIAGESTYEPEAWKDAWPRIAQSAIGGLVIGAPGGLFVAPRADTNGLQGIYSTDPKKFTDPIDTTSLERANAELKAMADRMRTEGDVEAADEVEAKSEQLATAKTKGEAAEIVNPFAAFGKLGDEFSSNLASAMDAATRSNAPGSVDSIKAIQTDVEDLLTRRRGLIDALNAQENEAADIEDIDVADKMIREIKREKGRVEKSINTELKTLNERVKTEFSGLVEQVSDQTVKAILKETSDAAQAREVGQDRVAERQQVDEGGLPTEAGSSDQLAESRQVQQEEVGLPSTLFHGTKEDFESFDPSRTGGMVHFTPDESVAARYASGSGGGRRRLSAKDTIVYNADSGVAYELKEDGMYHAIGSVDDTAKYISKDTLLPLASKEDAISREDMSYLSGEDGDFIAVAKNPVIKRITASGLKLLDLTSDSGKRVISNLPAVNDIASALSSYAKKDLGASGGDSLSGYFWNMTQGAARNSDSIKAGFTDYVESLGYDGVKFKDDQHETVALFKSGLDKAGDQSQALTLQALTDIVSPAQNDVQPTAFEAAKEQIRKDETLSPQEKNAAIRKAYDEAKASGGFERTKAVLKEIGNPNNVNDITQVIPNFAKLTDAIVRDLVAMGKAKFENYWNKFKEYVDEGTLKHVEERYGWQARNAYAEALNEIGVASSGIAEGAVKQQGEYDPAGFFAEGADGIRSRSANVDAGFEPDSVASRQAQGLHKTAAFYLLTGEPTNIIDQNGMGISYVVDGDHAYGVNERGGFFMLTDQGGGRVVLDSASTPRGTGLDVMAAAALTAKEVFGATELEGLMSSAGAWMRRGLYPSSRTDGISTDTITTSVEDMINRVVDHNVSPDVLVHAWGLLQAGDALGAYLAWNVARGTAGEVEFMRAGIDPFKLADDIVRMRNAETGSDKPTLSQALGIDTDRATPGDYYWGIMRAIKRLGSTAGDTSVRIRSKFGIPVAPAKEVAAFMHSYKPNPEQKRTRPAGYQKETTEQRVAHALKTSVQDALEAANIPLVKAMAKSVGVAHTKTINLGSIFRGEPSIDYRMSPELGGASPGVNALSDRGLRNLFHAGEAFSAESEKVKYAVRDAVDAAIEADSDPAISQEVQRALAIGTLAEITDADGKVIQTGGVLPEDELRAMFSDTFGGDKAKIDKAVSIYWKLRDGADKISEMVREAISYRTKKNIDEQNALISKETDPKLRDKYRENIRNLRNEEHQALERLRNGAYWPLIREGKWRVEVRHAESNKLLAVIFTDSRKEDAIAKKIAEAKFVSPELSDAIEAGMTVNSEAIQRPDFSALRAMGAAVFDESMALFMSRALGHDPEYAKDMARAVTTASVGDTFKLHQLTRSGVPGYTNRAGLSFQHLVNFSANMIANAYHADKLSNAVDAMSQGRMGEDYDPTAHNYAEAYVRNIRNPSFNKIVSMVKAGNYAFSLYGYTPFAIANKLQPWVVGLSKLGMFYGNNNSRRALGRAEVLVWRHMAMQLGIGSMEDLSNADAVAMIERLADRKNFYNYKHPTEIAVNVKAALMHALEVGDLRPSLSESLMGIGDSMIVTKMKKTSDALKRFFGVFALRSEQMNRVQTIIAAAMLATEHGVKDFDYQGVIATNDRSPESVSKFANLVNAVTNMSAGPHNTPAIAWNPYTGGMFQFKRILVDMVVAQHRIAKMASAGAPNNREAVAAYMKPWLTEMGVAAIFAGPAGSPMGAMLLGAVSMIIASYAKAFDVPEEEIKKGIKDRATSIWSKFFQEVLGKSKEDADNWAEGAVFTMMHGIPNAFGKGIDISPSMAPQLFFSPQDASALEFLATVILGPASMTISQAAKPIEESGFNRDSVIAAAKKLIPRGLRGIARAAGIAPYTMAGEPEGGFEKAASAVGFTPSRIAMNQVPTSEKFDISRSKRQTTNRLKLIVREASIKMLDAEKSGSKSKIDKADANFEKEIERARELMDEYHRSMEATGMPQEIWKINWQRDIMPSSKVERQERKREELPGWQK